MRALAVITVVLMAVSGLFGCSGLWADVAGLAILMSLPVVVIFLVLQRYLMDRYLIGAVEV